MQTPPATSPQRWRMTKREIDWPAKENPSRDHDDDDIGQHTRDIGHYQTPPHNGKPSRASLHKIAQFHRTCTRRPVASSRNGHDGQHNLPPMTLSDRIVHCMAATPRHQRGFRERRGSVDPDVVMSQIADDPPAFTKKVTEMSPQELAQFDEVAAAWFERLGR